jgi:hypothetical protein
MESPSRAQAAPSAAPLGVAGWAWAASLAGILLLALLLRLHGIHDPILDHPGWRQGDTASIARNFTLLRYDIMYPQTTYNGPPPNYVELELQIVPFLAATLYKFFGIHVVFGRLISIAFSLGTVLVLGFFARWLFADALAGIVAAFFYAVFPGSVYYGRTFTPDTAMVFFLSCALYATGRLLLEDPRLSPRVLARSTALIAFAYLAKPVAVLGIAPLLGAVWERARRRLPVRPTAIAVILFVPLLILWFYDRRVASYAEWRWASGITRLHVVPALAAALSGGKAFAAKLTQFRTALGMFRTTMLGPLATLLAVLSLVAIPWISARSKALLWLWLIGGLAYVYVVVTVERVDYYMAPLLPLCALAIGGALARFMRSILAADATLPARAAIAALVPVAGLVVMLQGRAAVSSYYHYDRQAYRNAVALNASLAKGALVVIGHYGPDVQYYIDRFGWEEDPLLWTPFDEESAIRKGARYFISVEDNRLRRNAELCAWLQRFPVIDAGERWPVYETVPKKMLPGADAFWRAFRTAERAGNARRFLDAHHVCTITAP